MIQAAGILIVCGGKGLFLQRADTGEWAFPGGHIEAGETAAQAAEREVGEEIGAVPFSNPVLLTRRIRDDVDFTTFVARTDTEFKPTLNDEHTAWCWAPLDAPPQPLHPGAAVSIARFGMDELGVARAMAAGDLVSPQRYGTFWMWKIRITGTGLAWRGAAKDEKTGKITREEEFCWRDRSIYLTPDFLARCNGLPVTLIHSQGRTNSTEWNYRAVGTVFLPFIEDEEVWAIAKIYDEDANGILLSGPFSTSPAVFFNAAFPAGDKVQLEDGTNLLIEGRPALLDSISLVPEGVWDKGGPPMGIVNNHLTEESVGMTDEEKAAADKARKELEDKLDSALAKLDAANARMDAMDKEREDRARKDAEEKARADRRDAARKDRFGARRDGESYKDYRARHDADEMAMCDALRKDGEDERDARDAARDARRDAEDAHRRSDESFDEWAKEEEKEPGHKKDARKDTDEEKAREKEEKERMEREDAARADAAVRQENSDLKARIAALENKLTAFTAETPAAERDALARAQARADGIAGMFGERAAPPLLGESAVAYRRRLAAKFASHSPRFKNTDLSRLDAEVLGPVEDIIYNDAATAAKSPTRAQIGMLIPLVERDVAGRQITKFTGDPMACWAPFMGQGVHGRINRNPKATA